MARLDAQGINSRSIFRYVIASGEMRFIEREERQVILGEHPERGLLLWGEIAGCGEACRADLSLLLLEHSMSCEGCEDPATRRRVEHAFTEQIGHLLAEELARQRPEDTPEGRARVAAEVLLASLRAGDTPPPIGESEWELDPCPLCSTARASGIVRQLEPVHRAFYDLLESTISRSGADLSVARPPINLGEEHPLPVRLEGSAA